jgi:hypothetical protein
VSWQPILDGELAERAWDAIRGIGDGVAAAQPEESDAALFWSYVSTALDDDLTPARRAARAVRAQDRRGVPGLRLWRPAGTG